MTVYADLYRPILYRSLAWATLVDQGWVTMGVSATGMALMLLPRQLR